MSLVYLCARRAIAATLVLICVGCASNEPPPVLAPKAAQPAPESVDWDTTAGVSDQILPGFEPLSRAGNRIELYARNIDWGDSYLPQSFSSVGSALARTRLSIVDEAGQRHDVVPANFAWTDTSPARTTVVADGAWGTLAISLRATVEYDGVVDLSLTLDPQRPTTVREVLIEADVVRQPTTQVLAYQARGIRRQKDRDDVVDLPYRGNFMHAINVADGNRSFWWFADNNRGWRRTGGRPVTDIVGDDDTITVRQRIVAGTTTLTDPVSVRFGLLATPVRAIEPERRARRVNSRYHSREDQRLGVRYKLWWPSAFAYDAYPHVDYVDGREAQLRESDRKGYPGLERNRKLLEVGRDQFDYHWIPYFSAHVISMFDPVMARNRQSWEIQPPKVFKDGLRPYSNAFDKPVLTHNAPGYSDYVVTRVRDIIDDLDMEGIYLDHGPPHDSDNPLNGGWRDENGKWQPSLDIFSMRDFMKRLRTVFIEKGKKGYVFIHISNREILPAYTFAYAIADGEQYRKRIRDANYLDVVSLDEFRTRFAARQYGVPTYWLHIDWTNHTSNKAYGGSERQKEDYRRTMALALLHDLPLWQHREPKEEHKRMVELLDRLPFDQAVFSGYWNEPSVVSVDNDKVKISQYRHGNTVLNVVANVSGQRQSARLRFAAAPGACAVSAIESQLSDPDVPSLAGAAEAPLQLAPFDYRFVTVRVPAGCPEAAPVR